MIINKNISISEIQNTFREEYPLLDLRFFRKPHKEYRGSMAVDEEKENVLLGRLNPNIQNGQIDISGTITVGQLETAFEEAFGLHVQVFRKSGKTWLQTSITDHWSLEHQQKTAAHVENFIGE